MYVYSMFPSDISDFTMWLQHDCYGPHVRYLYDAGKRAFLKAQSIVGVETELGLAAAREDSFDHRTLQYTHDLIAGWFRYKCAQQILQPYLPGIVDNQTHEERVTRKWFAFLRAEVDRLIERHIDLPRLILTASTFANPDKRGTDAENVLAERLHAEYASAIRKPW